MNKEYKYKIGETIYVNSWTGIKGPFKILDVQKTYHHRMYEYVWGYKVDGYTGLTMAYIPEGYIRLHPGR